MAPPDLAALLPSWELHLRAERKSPQTVKSYGDGARGFLRWCAAAGRPAVLDRPTVAAFVADLLGAGAEAATARSRQLALRRLSAWLAEEGETASDELLGVRPPKLDVKVVPVLTDDELRALVKACAGPEMWHRRDEALVRLMVETGARAGEVVALRLDDVDLARGLVTIRRGKGGKGRTVPVGPQTAKALDRYLRARRTHRLAGTDALWLGDRGKEFTYAGLHKGLKERAEAARHQGLPPARPAAHRRVPVAGRRRQRGRADGRGRLVPPGHDRPLRGQHVSGQGGRRGARAGAGGPVSRLGVLL